MQSTSAAIAAAVPSGADLGAKANSVKGSVATAKKSSTSGALGNNGFDVSEAEAWLQGRWKTVHANSIDKRIPETQRPEVYKAAAGSAGSAWGPNKKTVNERFTNDLLKASTATTASTKK
ncbi:hypothetical protein PSEUBRA_005192 [Kalmanozyma brasiliensis GHG001]|uniref:uncharacterized protein n=1 Tax=Kalmanozyma brasiliensis (strain GHG001) TaxID=1365824 RepID=UPI00286806CF|nr:uncharacterized protein PSEUBRA_005192 [Kalmanozyma brasiliensis GHG001]KAF6767489.1 hypothetical protein PSEUBRA_005192 [Kalmanozyma brasiliensis GHG001]